MAKEAGHSFLARLGKTRLRPGGKKATDWLIGQAGIGADTKVLEVACNMGTTMVGLSKKYGCCVTGVDRDDDTLGKARKNIEDNGLGDKISVMNADAANLPFDDGSFDVVINEAMLTMLPDEQKDKALAEYARILKPGGRLLTHDLCLMTDDPGKRKELVAGLRAAINVPAQPRTAAEWKAQIESHGFKTVQKTGPMTLMSPTGMIRDEGFVGALRIVRNGKRKENREQFERMRDFFKANKEYIWYIANFSTKE